MSIYQRQWAPPARATARSEPSATANRLTSFMSTSLPVCAQHLNGQTTTRLSKIGLSAGPHAGDCMSNYRGTPGRATSR